MRSLLFRPPLILALGMMLAFVLTRAVRADFVPVFGGPTYPTQEWISDPPVRVNSFGTAGGTAFVGPLILIDGFTPNIRAVRWDGSGRPVVALDSFLNVDGYAHSNVRGINDAGVAVGDSVVFTADGVRPLGTRAVRWEGPGSAVTELGNLGTDSSGQTFSKANAVNAAGTAVGQASKYDASHNYVGERAVRWDASGTAAVELAFPSDYDDWSIAIDVNDSGVTIGSAEGFKGSRPVRWDASGEPTLLDPPIGTDPGGGPPCVARAINNAGTAVGNGPKYSASGTNLGHRAIRWGAGGTAATELRGLGISADGTEYSNAWYGINDAGDIVGNAYKYDELGNILGNLAVRWDADSVVPTELDHLGHKSGRAYAINNAGVAVGYIYTGEVKKNYTAAYWLRDGTAVDLNTLIDPDSGWHLRYASDISDTGWITGYGNFDADGPVNEESYQRLFLIHVPEAASLAGDYNHNGVVEAADYVVWRNNDGSPDGYNAWRANFGGPVSLAGDYNNDGVVDATDYVVWRNNDGTPAEYDTWRANFGRTAGSDSALPSTDSPSASVPEPTCGPMVSFAGAAAAACLRCLRGRNTAAITAMQGNQSDTAVWIVP